MEVTVDISNEATRRKKRRRRSRRKKSVIASASEINTPLETSIAIGHPGTKVAKCLKKRKRYRKRRCKKISGDVTVQLVPRLLLAKPDDVNMETDTMLCNHNQTDPSVSAVCICPVSRRGEPIEKNGADKISTTVKKRRKRHKPRKKKCGVEIQLSDLKDISEPPQLIVKPAKSTDDIAVGSIINFKRLILQGMEPAIVEFRAKVFLKLKLQSGTDADTLLVRTLMPQSESFKSTRDLNVCFSDEPEMIKFTDMFDVSVEEPLHPS